MQNRIFYFSIIVCSFLFLSNACDKNSSVETDNSAEQIDQVNNERMSFTFDGSYDNMWAKVDSLEKKGLYKSALDVVNLINAEATKNNNAPEIVKCVIHKLKYNSYLEEDDYVLALSELRTLSKKSTTPLKQLIHSITGQVYWQYYSSQRWIILQRTNTINFENADIKTWDVNQFIAAITTEYELSLENAEMLKQINIADFSSILMNVTQESKVLTPTLFDFLAQRAIEQFSNSEMSISRPNDKFVIDSQAYFGQANDFVNLKIETKDSLSIHLRALQIQQELERFHLIDSDQTALVNNTLNRFTFVHQNCKHENANKWYEVALQKMASNYANNELSATVNFYLGNHYFNLGKQASNKEDENYGMIRKAYDLLKNSSDTYPKSSGAINCQSTMSEIEQKEFSFNLEQAYSTSENVKFLLNFKNIEKVHFKVVQVEWDNFKLNRHYGEDFIKELLKQKELLSWSKTLPSQTDFHSHSIELAINKLGRGHYYLIASHNEKFSTSENSILYSSFWISDLSYTKRHNKNGSATLFIADRSTGKPLNNVKVELYQNYYNNSTRKTEFKVIENYISDDKGMVNTRSHENYNSFYIHLRKDDDQYNTDNSSYFYNNNYDEESYSSTTFFTDRAIYRPGQTIYFKGIQLRNNGKNHTIEANKKTKARFYDVNYQLISEVDVTTNDFGTFSGSFVAPTAGLNGNMTIETDHGSHSIQVEEYKRPKFEVTINPFKGNYKLGTKLTVEGKAVAYSGSIVNDAKVSYRITRNASIPYWMYYRWSYIPFQNQTTEIEFGEVKTDENGNFKIPFLAEADKSIDQKYMPNFGFTIQVDVTDINGETRSSTSYVTVGSTALTLSNNIPNQLDKNDGKSFYVYTNNLNSQKIPTKGKLTVTEIIQNPNFYRTSFWGKPDLDGFTKEEYEKLFPNDAFGNEQDVSKLTRGKQVTSLNFDTEKSDSIQFSNLNQWETGRYVIEMTAIDTFGNEVKDVKYIELKDRRSTKVGIQTIWSCDALTTTAEPGETAEFLLTSSTNLNVLYQVELDGEILSTELIPLNNEQKIVKLPIVEKYRGNVTVHFTSIRFGRAFTESKTIYVPYSNKELELTFETFRNKLVPGAPEEWRLRVKGPNGEKVAAELLIAMYDASLDEFATNSFYLNPYESNYSYSTMDKSAFGAKYSQNYSRDWNNYRSGHFVSPISLNWFGYYFYDSYYGYKDYANAPVLQFADMSIEEVSATSRGSRNKNRKEAEETDFKLEGKVSSGSVTASYSDNLASYNWSVNGQDTGESTRKPGDLSKVQARTNLNETAFFYPQLQTDANGDVLIKFTSPEALTRWKVLGLAHTKDLKIGAISEETVTQKELMVQPNNPRFFREGDQITYSAKISNLSDNDVNGTSQLFVFETSTMKALDAEFKNTNAQQNFEAKKGQSTSVDWELFVPEGVGAVTIKVVAQTSKHSDGEENVIPVLSNRLLVTESLPLPIKGIGTKDFTFDKLLNSDQSTTLRHHSVTLEYTSNPAWYAVQALPYMMEYPYECAEQTFSRFYANSIASNIVNSNPKIKQVFESWKTSSPDSFLSNLEKNQELKSVILEETPWVLDAQDESERKKRVALLFDMNKMDNELNSALKKLEQMQVSNGGWPWFPGMEESRYITQHIVTGMGHLDNLEIKNIREDQSTWNMIKKAVKYLDDRIVEDFERIKKHYPKYKNEQHISEFQAQYLYARSYFKDIPMSPSIRNAVEYFEEQASAYWLNFGIYNQGMIALAAHRKDNSTLASAILASLKERAIINDELGMYWKTNVWGYYWYEAPIETQALLIEAFDEISNDTQLVNELKVWLLKQKQTSDWKTTKATAEACYALLLRGSSFLDNSEMVEVKINGNVFDPASKDSKIEAGTGYFKSSWAADEITPSMGNISVTRKTEGVSWGAMYWQYFEDLDKITSNATNLKLDKQLFLVKNTASGPVITPLTSSTKLVPGDKIKVRIELRTDRNMEYVHMKDQRAAGFEPLNVISSYRYKSGLGYYESTKDAATHFFFDYLPKGTHVFEYELRVSHNGDFSNGITLIECMYAPEFKSHSEGIRVKVGE